MNKQAVTLTQKGSGTPTGTCKLLKQYILSLRRKGNVKSPGAEGITSTFPFMLQGHATQSNKRKGLQGEKQCVKSRQSTVYLSLQSSFMHLTFSDWCRGSLDDAFFKISMLPFFQYTLPCCCRKYRNRSWRWPPQAAKFISWSQLQSLRDRELSLNQDQKMHLFKSSASLKDSLRLSKAYTKPENVGVKRQWQFWTIATSSGNYYYTANGIRYLFEGSLSCSHGSTVKTVSSVLFQLHACPSHH